VGGSDEAEGNGNLFGEVLREMKVAGGIGRLPKVVEEQALFAAELHTMASFHPGQHGRIAVERMRKVGVRAALGKQGRPWRVHQKGWHTHDSVRLVQHRGEDKLHRIGKIVDVSWRDSPN